MKRSLAVILLLIAAAISPRIQAQQAEWEIGASLAAFRLPLYPGSADSKSWLLPLPFIVLRSEFLDIDEGVRAKLLHATDVHLNLSADFGVPVSSKDSAVRQGMPNLDTVLQVGPSLEITLSGGRRQPHHFRLELPVRLAIATDLKDVESLSWVLEPRLTYETRRPFRTGFAWQLTAGLRYASQDYHRYYYAVPAAFATATRPAYDTGAGFSAVFTDLVLNWRDDELIWWTFLRYQDLGGGVYADSPLLQREQYWFVGVGLTWVLAESR
jgi:outer membrane protein